MCIRDRYQRRVHGGMYSEEITGLVIDLGSETTRGGYSGEDVPQVYIPSSVGVLEDPDNPMRKRYYVGDSTILVRRDHMDIVESIRGGAIVDKEAAFHLLQGIFVDHLRLPSKPQYPLLMSEPGKHSQEHRQRLGELVFEQLEVPSFFTVKSPVLACFASGRSTALVLDSGATTTIAAPVHDGYVLQKSLNKHDIGGDTVIERLRAHVEKRLEKPIVPPYEVTVSVDSNMNRTYETVSYPHTHPRYATYARKLVLKDMKETICKVAENPAEIPRDEKVEYVLPDGKTLPFDDSRYQVSECLFTSTMEGPDPAAFKGIHHMVLDAINKADLDLRKELLSSIVVTGGNTLLPGFIDRLQRKLCEIAPQNAKVKIISYPTPIERKFATWIGGSIPVSYTHLTLPTIYSV
eukprot:TRINITY_DN388_c0_g6_i1.p1 TRINITY_DN388_c0_g6~~TRINITY_DN388_c0_g6_i1.p1  ORF type:complete len:406 (-),score=63.81 TRINITY_DN388_c0_g6_i1:36-1253(-)